MRRTSRLAGVLGILALLIAACGGGTDATTTTAAEATTTTAGGAEETTTTVGAPTGDPIVLGGIFALTGPSSFVASQSAGGIQLAVAEINAAGGVLGRPLEANVQDDQCQPAEGVSAARRLIEVEDIRLIIGAQCSSSTLAIMPVLQELEALMINTASTNPAITEQGGVGGNPWIFRNNPPDSAFAPAMAKIMADQGVEKLAVVAVNDDLGRGAAEEFRKALQVHGSDITFEHFFSREGQLDFSSALTEIRESDADAILFVGTIDPGLPFLRQYRELGLTQPLYSRGLSLTKQLFDEAGDVANGLHSTEPYYVEIDSPENQRFIEAFRAMHDMDPVYQAYTAYEAVYLYAAAIEAAGSTEPEAVQAALESVTREAITGTMTFDDHHQAHIPVYVARATCEATCRVEIVGSDDTWGNR